MQNNTPLEIIEQLKKCKKIIMTLHPSPDGDSLGSATALKYILEKQCNASVDLISGDTLSNDLMKIDLAQEVDFTRDLADVDFTKYDLLLCVDQATTGMLSEKMKDQFKLPENITVVNIDHHPTNPFYGTLNYVTPESSSSCEVLLDIFRATDIHIDHQLAKRLLTGICTDTGFFKYSINAQGKVFSDAAFLIQKGINYKEEIITPLTLNTPLSFKKFLGLVYSNIQYNSEDKFYYVALSQKQWQDAGLSEDEIGGASNHLGDLADASFVFTLIEKEDGVQGSFRSRTNVDVSQFAQALGGGGHKPAAGLFLRDMKIEEALAKVLNTIKQVGIQRF